MDTDVKMPSSIPSTVPVDILIPAIDKDFEVLTNVVDAARHFLQHPIGKIYIVAPQSQTMLDFCATKNTNFINEREVLPICKSDIHYIVNGVNRAGWLYQQLLKLNGDQICEQENFVVMDADTVLIRPCVFMYYGKTIFRFANGYHQPYFDTYSKLMNLQRRFPMSFIAHQMLFEKNKLINMKRHIEIVANKVWYEAIINNINPAELSCFSEYETYGNYVITNYPDDAIIEYWNNLSLKRSMINYLQELISKFSPYYRSISFHSYNI